MNKVIKNLKKEELIEKYFEQEKLLNELNSNIKNLSNELLLAKNLFENSPTPMWEEDITELMNYIDELKKNGIEDFRNYFDKNPNELKTCIKKINPLNVNFAVVNLHKAKTKDELLNNLDHVFIEEAMGAFRDELVAIANGETSFICLTKAKTLNNQKLDLKLYLQISKTIINSSLKYIAVVSTVNITEQKQAEDKVLKSEKALRTILDTTDDIAILLDTNGFILESNKACHDFYNVKKIDIIGRKLSYFGTEEVVENRRFYFRRAIKEKRTVTFENAAYDKMWASTISPLLDANGDVEKLVVFHKDITSKYFSEKKLRDRELKFKSIFNNIQTSIVHIDRDGFITDINEYHLKHISKSKRKRQDYIGTNIIERDSIIKAGIIDYYKELLKGKQFEIKNVYFPITTGEESSFFNIQGIPLFEDGKINGAIITTEDVTEDVTNKQKIVQIEQRLSLALEGAGIGFWEEDIVNNTFLRSNYWFEMLGYQKSEFSDNIETWRNLLHPDDLHKSMSIVKKHYKGEIDQIRVEHRLKNSQNNYQWILNWGKVIERDEQGNPIRAAGIHLDITERKLNEESLRQYANIVSSSSDMLALVDKNYFFLAANKAYLKAFNLIPDELIGKSVSEIFGDKFFNSVLKPYAEKCVSGGDVNYQEWIDFSESSKAFMDISYFPYKDSENNVLGFVVNARDITKRYEIENELKESEDKFSKIFKMTPYVLIISRLSDGKLLDFNDYTMEIIGLTREEMLDKTSTDLGLITFEQRSILIDKIKSQGFFSNIELEVSLPNGEKRIGLFHGRQIKLGNEECLFQTILDITDRIKAEHQVRESEEKFHKIFRNSPDTIILTRFDDGVLVEVNDSTLKFTDVKLDDLIGKKTADIFVWEDLAQRNEYLEKLSKSNRIHNYEANFRMKDGETRNCLLSGERIKINNIDYILAIIRDVTEEKKAETALIESESKYRMLVENQSDLVVEVDKLNQFTFVSPSYCRLFGKNESELLGKSFYPLIHEDDRGATEEEMKKLFNIPYTCRIQQRAMTIKGWRWLEWNDTAQLDHSNNVKSILGVGRDITDKKEAELALISSEEKFYKIFKNSPDGIILTRMKDSEVIDANDSTTEITGYKHSEIVGKRTTQIPLWSNLEDRVKYVDLLSKHGLAKSLIFEFIKKDGEKRTGMLSGVLLELNNEKLIMGILRDVTEKTIFEKKLQDTNERLRNLARYMDNVREEERKKIAREVHDNLGQKLTALNLDISWIKQSIPKELVELNEQFDPVLEMINQSIITVQKISTELRPGILDDLGLINAIQWQSNEISRRTDLNFSLNMYKAELELEDNVKTAIFRVYQEALTNIVRHAQAKNVLVNLLIKENNLIFEVIDDGIGISESDINEFTSYGIIGMKERILAIGGEIIFTRLTKGTMLKIKVRIRSRK